MVFPKDKNGFDIDDQYFIGSSGLLVKPVTEKGQTEASVYLPEDEARDPNLHACELLTSSPLAGLL